MSDFTRRKFLQSASVLAAGSLTLPGFVKNGSLHNLDDVRIGFIGTGLRGRNHVNNLLRYEGVHCPAICDIDPEAITQTKELFDRHGKPAPKVYTGSDHAYLEMLEQEDLDGVIIATNWKWHTPMCLAAMKNGVYTGVEVSGAFSVDECWELVRAHQETGTHLFFLENVNYRRDVMAVLIWSELMYSGNLSTCAAATSTISDRLNSMTAKADSYLEKTVMVKPDGEPSIPFAETESFIPHTDLAH